MLGRVARDPAVVVAHALRGEALAVVALVLRLERVIVELQRLLIVDVATKPEVVNSKTQRHVEMSRARGVVVKRSQLVNLDHGTRIATHGGGRLWPALQQWLLCFAY